MHSAARACGANGEVSRNDFSIKDFICKLASNVKILDSCPLFSKYFRSFEPGSSICDKMCSSCFDFCLFEEEGKEQIIEKRSSMDNRSVLFVGFRCLLLFDEEKSELNGEKLDSSVFHISTSVFLRVLDGRDFESPRIASVSKTISCSKNEVGNFIPLLSLGVSIGT